MPDVILGAQDGILGVPDVILGAQDGIPLRQCGCVVPTCDATLCKCQSAFAYSARGTLLTTRNLSRHSMQHTT